MEEYLLSVGCIAGIYALLSLSLHLSWGQMGVVNLGIAAFFGIGGYTSALLSRNLGVPIPLAMLAATVAGGLAGAAVSRLTRHLQDDYLAIVTLGFAEVVRLAASNEIWLTNGSDGISGIPAPFGQSSQSSFLLLFFALITAAVCLFFFLVDRIRQAPLGRLLRAIRDDQTSVGAAGKDVARVKMSVFALSAALAALGGAFYVHYTSYISPDIFRPLLTIYIFLGLSIGGRGNTRGAVLGGVLIVALVEGARFLGPYVPGISGLQQAALREIAIALIFILTLIHAPNGLLPEALPDVKPNPAGGDAA